MLKINPLIDLFFTDLPFPERMGKIAECGYRYVETWQGANGKLLKEMENAGKECGVELISIVMNGPGNRAAPNEETAVGRISLPGWVKRVDEKQIGPYGKAKKQLLILIDFR